MLKQELELKIIKKTEHLGNLKFFQEQLKKGIKNHDDCATEIIKLGKQLSKLRKQYDTL